MNRFHTNINQFQRSVLVRALVQPLAMSRTNTQILKKNLNEASAVRHGPTWLNTPCKYYEYPSPIRVMANEYSVPEFWTRHTPKIGGGPPPPQKNRWRKSLVIALTRFYIAT